MRKISTLFFLLSYCFIAFAQQNSPLPIDSAYLHGKLDNGMTYFIRQNKTVEKRAEFYIVQRVGSIQEDDHQAGLAHFLEHMAFNGTTHFPDKDLLNYLEKNGIKFGVDINAYTSFDETVYNISNVPLTGEGIVDSCLLILHDWSCGILLKEQEIDNERGVIKEEWRTRGGAQQRLLQKILPDIFPNNKYAHRLPIGSMDIVENCSYEDLRSFYHKWYRPDLQTIIVIGDIDKDQIEAKVKELFSKIPARNDVQELAFNKVEDNEEPLVSIVTDEESTRVSASLYFKHEIVPFELRATEMMFVSDYVRTCAISMLNKRFSEIAQKPNSPFLYASASYGNFFVAKSKDAFTVSFSSAEDKVQEALTAVMAELEKMKRFGFLESEYERVKSSFLSGYESAFNERNKTRNGSYANECVQYVLSGTAMPGIEFEYNTIKMLVPNIPLQAVNGLATQLATENNIVLSISGPEKKEIKYPTKEELSTILKSAKDIKVEAYAEELITEPLISKLPKAGKIKKEKKDDKFESKVLSLSNGMRVILKKTDFKDDQILMNAISWGGTSNFPIEEIKTTQLLGQLMTLGGVGNFDVIMLSKMLAGKNARVLPSIGLRTQGISGSTTIKDLETMLQLTHLYLTQPRTDDEAFEAFIQKLRPMLKNSEAEPRTAYGEAISEAMYADNPRNKPFKVEDLDAVNYHRAMEQYKECFKNPGSLIFTFVGNIDEDALKPLLKKYLASIPKGKTKTTAKDVDQALRKGKFSNIFEKEMKTPRSSVFNMFSGDMPKSQVNDLKMSILTQILNIVYTEKVREDEGGTYGVGVSGSIARYPENQTTLTIGFDTDPQKAEFLNGIIHKELLAMAENGPRTDDFNKVKEYIIKNHSERVKQNSYWAQVLQMQQFHNEDIYSDYLSNLNSISENDIKEFAKQLISQGNEIIVMMHPKSEDN